MSLSANPPISIRSVGVFLCIQTFQWFHRKLLMFFLFLIILSGGLSTYANKNHILLSMAWFMIIFFPISERFRCFDCHFLISLCISFLTFSSFFPVILVSELSVYPNMFFSKHFCLQPFFPKDPVFLMFT